MRHERIAGARSETALVRALVAAARARGLAATVVAHASRPWASATFVGARHDVSLRVAHAPGWAEWLATLGDATLHPHGHLVADLAIDRIDADGDAALATLAVLTIEES